VLLQSVRDFAGKLSHMKGRADASAGQLKCQPGKRTCFEDTAEMPAVQLAHLLSQVGLDRFPEAVQLYNQVFSIISPAYPLFPVLVLP